MICYPHWIYYNGIRKHVAFLAKGTQLDTLFSVVSMGEVSICSLEVATRHSWKCRKTVSEVGDKGG